ncbi:hypothetical protein, partial [Klebsiella pneumoniae]
MILFRPADSILKGVISFLIPIVCGSGFIIAIGMGLGGTVQDTL